MDKIQRRVSRRPRPQQPAFLSPANLARARLTIALITACSIVIAFFLLKKSFGLRIAAFAAIFLAVDPLFLIQSRRFHTDALATVFLLLAILALFANVGRRIPASCGSIRQFIPTPYDTTPILRLNFHQLRLAILGHP